MASKLSFSIILCIFSIWVVNGADHAPAPSVDCSSVIISMSDCLSFVTNGSTVTEPKKTCCSGLEHVVKTSPACLCEVFKTSAKLGVALNLTKAASLPEACKVTAPSVSSCGLSVAPAHAPAPGAIHSPPPSPSTPGTPPPSLDHEEHSPPPSPPHSGGNSASALFPISAASILLCLLVAVFSGF